MGKIFLFWSIILIVLITGIAAIIYGKMLLKTEEEKAEGIIRELSATAIPKVDTLPPAEEMETEEMLEEIKPPELVLPPEEQQSLPPVSQ